MQPRATTRGSGSEAFTSQDASSSSISQSQPKSVKVLLLGDASVGKTSLRNRLIYHSFSEAYRATVGGDYLTSNIETEFGPVMLQVWDTAGQERFNSLGTSFYRGTDVAILVYDCTNPASFSHLTKWFHVFIENVHVASPSLLIVGNKIDKTEAQKISLRQAKEFASLYLSYYNNVPNIQPNELSNLAANLSVTQTSDTEYDPSPDCFEASAKSNTNVNQIFKRAAYLGTVKSVLNESNAISKLSFDNDDQIDISRPLKGKSFLSCC